MVLETDIEVGNINRTANGLNQLTSVGTTRFLWDGLDLIGEFDASGVLKKRYVHGDGMDEPLAAYSCASLGWSCRTYPQQDERGSIISIVNADASVAAINRYDEYGKPQGGSITGRFGYTGQLWIGEVGAYYYKARFYSPALGRFYQPDPTGYADSPNLYAYVLNDPVNLVDPSGLIEDDAIIVSAPRITDLGTVIFRAWQWRRSNRLDFNTGEQGGRRDRAITRVNHQCRAVPISDKERRAAAAGDRVAFWSSRAARGDPLGQLGLDIALNRGILGQAANGNLAGAIRDVYGALPTDSIRAEINDIGVGLMNAHVALVDRGLVANWSNIRAYHIGVFAQHGLPATAFGGNPITGSRLEGWGLRNIWRSC